MQWWWPGTRVSSVWHNSYWRSFFLLYPCAREHAFTWNTFTWRVGRDVPVALPRDLDNIRAITYGQSKERPYSNSGVNRSETIGNKFSFNYATAWLFVNLLYNQLWYWPIYCLFIPTFFGKPPILYYRRQSSGIRAFKYNWENSIDIYLPFNGATRCSEKW